MVKQLKGFLTDWIRLFSMKREGRLTPDSGGLRLGEVREGEGPFGEQEREILLGAMEGSGQLSGHVSVVTQIFPVV